MHLNVDSEAEEKNIAIISFLNQKQKLAFYEDSDETWVSDTAGLVEKYIGTETSLYDLIKKISFSPDQEIPQFVDEVYMKSLVERQHQADRLIDIFIDFIEQNGTLQMPSSKDVSFTAKSTVSVNNWLFILILLVTVFSLGIWLGLLYGK